MILVDIGNSGLRATHVPKGQQFDPQSNSVYRLSWTAASTIPDKPSPKQSSAPNQRWCEKNDVRSFAWLISNFENFQNEPWVISSVQQTASKMLLDCVAAQFRDPLIHSVRYSDIPMKMEVNSPDKTGIDRLVAAYGARSLYMNDEASDPLIIVQAGTAITVDWVDHRGVYCGGSIMPGLGLSLQFLAAGTDQLPWLGNHAVESEPKLPGKNTIEAMSAGVNAAIVGGTLHLINRYRDSAANSRSARVVITGGDGKIIVPHVIPPVKFIEHLIFTGLCRLSLDKS